MESLRSANSKVSIDGKMKKISVLHESMTFLSNMSYIEDSNLSLLMKQADTRTFCPPPSILLTLLWQGL